MVSRDSNRIAGAVIVLLAAAVLWEGRVLPIGSFANPGPGALPTGLAAMLGGLGALIAWRGGGVAFGALKWVEGPRALGILAATAFAAAAIEPLGYRLTIFAVVLFLLGVLERKRPIPAALAALTLAEGSYLLFADFLRTPLPVGPFGI